MSDAQTLARLNSALIYLERAFTQLEGVDGLEDTQEAVANLCMDVEMQIEEFISVTRRHFG